MRNGKETKAILALVDEFQSRGRAIFQVKSNFLVASKIANQTIRLAATGWSIAEQRSGQVIGRTVAVADRRRKSQSTIQRCCAQTALEGSESVQRAQLV